jgi:hypothetical protein
MKRERRFRSHRKMALYSLASRGRPGNIPTAAAWSSVCRHVSGRVAPLTIRRADPRRPCTIQTCLPPVPLSATRLSDGGPDHPAHVAALGHNCHRRDL